MSEDDKPVSGRSAHDDIEIQAIISILAELNASLISKSQAEYLYTAAAIGGFGAVSWGVGALRDGTAFPFFHPAIVALIGIATVAAAVIYKIVHDHGLYVANQALIVDLRREIVKRFKNSEWFPKDLLRREPDTKFPSGYLVSISVILASASASGLFCVSMFLYGKPP